MSGDGYIPRIGDTGLAISQAGVSKIEELGREIEAKREEIAALKDANAALLQENERLREALGVFSGLVERVKALDARVSALEKDAEALSYSQMGEDL